MVVTGGITWWKDFICTACFNLLDQRDEVRGKQGMIDRAGRCSDGEGRRGREEWYVHSNIVEGFYLCIVLLPTKLD